LLDAAGIAWQRADMLPRHGTVMIGADAAVTDADLGHSFDMAAMR